MLQSIATFNDYDIDIDHEDVRPQAMPGNGSGFALDEERGLMGTNPLSPISPRSPRRVSRSGGTSGRFGWWHSWLKQMGRLFSPKWRRTVTLMWIIWAGMAFGEFRRGLI